MSDSTPDAWEMQKHTSTDATALLRDHCKSNNDNRMAESLSSEQFKNCYGLSGTNNTGHCRMMHRQLWGSSISIIFISEQPLLLFIFSKGLQGTILSFSMYVAAVLQLLWHQGC